MEGGVLVLLMLRWGLGWSVDPASRFFRLQRWRHRSISVVAVVITLFDTWYCTTKGSEPQLRLHFFYMEQLNQAEIFYSCGRALSPAAVAPHCDGGRC